jgi:hypothetical protein
MTGWQKFAQLPKEFRANYQLMSERHNGVVRVVREAVLKVVDGNLSSDIEQNTTMPPEGLAQGLKAIRPGMMFEREGRGRRVAEIFDFSCASGYVSHEPDTLATVSEQKKRSRAIWPM